MNTNIESRKAEIIAYIVSLTNEATLKSFEDIVVYFERKEADELSEQIFGEPEVAYLAKPKHNSLSQREQLRNRKPIQKNISLAKLKKSRNGNPTNLERMKEIAREMDIQEPIDLLLSQLTK